MPELNLRKPHVEFGGGEGLRPVILQNGFCFSHDGTQLSSDPQILQAQGFAVPKDLRKTLLRERHKREAEMQMGKIRADLEAKQAEEMQKLEAKLKNVSELGDDALDSEIKDLLSDMEDPDELEEIIAAPEPAPVKDKMTRTSRGSSIKTTPKKK